MFVDGENMEVELKFLIEDSLARDRILKDNHLATIADEGSQEEIELKATYFDTDDLDFCKQKIAFRVRFENDKLIATLKWGGEVKDGLHVRGELNAPVDLSYIENPKLDIFKDSEIYDEIKSLRGDKPLKPIMEINCLRKQMTVDTGLSIDVVSLDIGEIVTPKGNAPIAELEIELYSGDKDDMVALGRELAAKYNLQVGEKSKFQVGLELLGIE